MRIWLARKQATAVFLIIFLATAVPPLHAAPVTQTAVPEADYWQQIQELQLLVAEIEGLPAADQQAQLAAAADELARITAVTLPDGQTLPIDHSFLLSELRAEPPNPDRLSGLLAALTASRETWPEEAQFNAAAAVPLAEILARSEFQYQSDEPNAVEQWFLEMQQRFLKWLLGILPEGNVQIGSIFSNALAVLAVIALAAVLFIALRGMLTDFAADAELSAVNGAEEAPLTAESALSRAQTLSESGDNRTAVRYLYLSSLLQMEERGLLRYDRSRTNREYLRLIRDQPELTAALSDVVDVFDRVWYGYQPVDEETFQHYRRRVVALRQIRSKES